VQVSHQRLRRPWPAEPGAAGDPWPEICIGRSEARCHDYWCSLGARSPPWRVEQAHYRTRRAPRTRPMHSWRFLIRRRPRWWRSYRNDRFERGCGSMAIGRGEGVTTCGSVAAGYTRPRTLRTRAGKLTWLGRRLLFAPGTWYDEQHRPLDAPAALRAARTPPNQATLETEVAR
jgi:hypothetical protein